MSNLYSRVFSDIFSACEPYIVHDFLNIKGDNGDKQNFILFTYRKIFDETIKVLSKSRYNGEIFVYNKIVFDKNNIISSNEVIKTTSCYTKGKIVVNNNIIKLANAHDADKDEKITIIPIDGIPSFCFGKSDFSMVLILQEKINDVFQIKNISIFNPITRDIFEVDDEGCKYNGKKTTNDNLFEDKLNNIIFVNDGSSDMNFDLTKLSQTANNLFISKSVFSSLIDFIMTKMTICIVKINKDMLPFVEYICKYANLKTKIIGEHLVIEKNYL